MAKALRLFALRSEYNSHICNIAETSRPETCYCRDGRLVSYHPIIVNIISDNSISAESCKLTALVKGRIKNNITFSIESGSQYASITQSGQLTINSNANNSSITVAAKWGVSVTRKQINVTYLSGSSVDSETEVIENLDGTTTEQTIITTNNPDGSTSTETNTSNFSEDGNITSQITSELIENLDGSSSENSTTINYDENGDVESSSETEITTNANGSYTGSTTNYDASGDPVDGSNVNGDVDGNVSTQNVEYDENGDTVVTGYTIDTSGSESGEKSFHADGVNTEYYAFDMTHGFILNLNFTFDYANQPANQQENHHNVLTMKRATPEPWYGFQIRHTGANKYLILGTQFSTGKNTNTNIPQAHGTLIRTNVYEYNITITYNPTASTNKFVAYNNITHQNIFTNNNTFPDIEELRYLKVTIGYAMDANGNPYRYSNIDVKNFSITRLSNEE